MNDVIRPAFDDSFDPSGGLSSERAAESRKAAAAVRQWRRRARIVRLARRALPLSIGLIVLLLVGVAAMRTFQAAQAENEAQRASATLVNARFYGQDRQGRAFLIGAATARQMLGAVQGPVALEQPTLEIGRDQPDPTRVRADRGVYDQRTGILTLHDDVRINEGGQGFEFRTQTAVVDTRTGVVSGRSPVEGQGPMGSISASSYAIYDQGARIVFRGSGDNKVRATINDP
ncbi:LPS export ABC transporter periplasmic protein LptC [Brevundimonas sp. 2R-24]|uniref:LPS export ABC transporter periplasmic protein LptC n=1 Tax=Peiella sedimenti TaxID=3061083 RepID=A0ABT8SH37_9CAUL|nr:LPS export ABC transporter periplasmic protein LptC [Caulobacteraceae bacterium XZ-24]